MINLSLDELRQMRNISEYENKSKEDLIKTLSEPKPETKPKPKLETKPKPETKSKQTPKQTIKPGTKPKQSPKSEPEPESKPEPERKLGIKVNKKKFKKTFNF